MAPRVPGPPGPDEPLLSNSTPFADGRLRARRDTGWLIAYLIVLALALGGGVFSFAHRNTRYGELLKPDAFTDPTLCPAGAPHSTRRLLQQGPDAPPAFSFDLFMKAAGAWVGASAGGAILVGLLFVWLVRRSPGGLVALAVALQVGVPAGMGLAALLQGSVVPGVLLLALAGITLLAFMLWRPQIQLVTQLLGLAGHGLAANPGLVPLALCIQVVLLGVVELPLLIALIAGVMNGSLAYNAERADQGAAQSAEQCVDADGSQVVCCVWQLEQWVPAYLSVAGLAMTWSLFLAFQIKLYTVSGAVAQWFFAPASEGGAAASLSAPSGRELRVAGPRRSRTLAALGFALGPSLGSLCCGSAILTLVSMIRQAIEKARQERDRNLLAACAAACLGLILGFIEYITRFATVRCAITGEAFLDAGRNVVALLARNAMDAFGVWWLPPLVVQSCCFVLAVCWAVLVFFVSLATTWAHQAGSSPSQATASAAITAVVALLASWAVLAFLASLLLNVIDALFVAFAMDRDAGQVSVVEVYEVFVKLPSVGPVVQQPDGGIAYGAPAQEQDPYRGSVARV